MCGFDHSGTESLSCERIDRFRHSIGRFWSTVLSLDCYMNMHSLPPKVSAKCSKCQMLQVWSKVQPRVSDAQYCVLERCPSSLPSYFNKANPSAQTLGHTVFAKRLGGNALGSLPIPQQHWHIKFHLVCIDFSILCMHTSTVCVHTTP